MRGDLRDNPIMIDDRDRQLSLFKDSPSPEAADKWWFEHDAHRNGFWGVAGVDEAGRGPLAGPVVSAAVILPESFAHSDVDDSKKLTPNKRDRLFECICDQAVAVGVGIVDAIEIDRRNILQASLLSMVMAVEKLDPRPDFLLIDGIFPISSPLPQKPIKKGDSRSISIAAASIVAKVTRDRMMDRYHEAFPQFGFNRHKGYPTKDHRAAIQKYGCCPIHRKTFKGVREYL